MPTKAPLPKEQLIPNIGTTFESNAVGVELEELYGL